MTTINLSRKWRSQDFDQLVGQDLVVRILKNSLYLGHYFPVYLFAGQRGCGKTSTARIFATAINCHGLQLFQKDPKKFSVPCLDCQSCKAMRDGNHPDFIEIDAASHTGVDNVRALIDSSLLLPIMGRKRVYLIDEAHMLSKAAFNAALKILEEPPTTALFILATTNQHKIIDTVRSRCFQLFFMPIPNSSLKGHIKFICQEEKIAYIDDALDLIVQHTEGSARDALNLLEQIRFSSSIVSKEAVLAFLGHIDDQHIMTIIKLIVQGSATELVQLLHLLDIDRYKAEFVWQRLVILLRKLLWVKHGIKADEITTAAIALEGDIQWCCLADLHQIIEALYKHEELFFKTVLRNIFLEMILLDLCRKVKKKAGDGNGSTSSPVNLAIRDIIDDEERHDDKNKDICNSNESIIEHHQRWQRFIAAVEKIDEPLIYSIFKQARFITYAVDTHCISIELFKDLVFFKDTLDAGKNRWLPLLQENFVLQITLDMRFTRAQKEEGEKKQKSDQPILVRPSVALQHKTKSILSQPHEQTHNSNYYNIQKSVTTTLYKNERSIDVSDANIWKTASMVLRHFPGTLTEIRENQ